MAYWWVSQNQTFNHEVPGGYLWAPKTDKNGNVPQSYLNMTLIKRGDIVFSFANQKIMAVGVALGEAVSSQKPKVFAKAGDAWNDEGWKVDVLFERPPTVIEPKHHLPLLIPLMPESHAPIRSDGQGNQAYLFSISDSLGSVLLGLTNSVIPPIPAANLDELSFNEEEQEIISQTSLKETEKASLVMARRGQGLFRSHVQVIEKACRVTGLEAEKFLIASHIKPWKSSDNQERLDGNNGLFLSPHVDKLFDSGFITFTKTGSMEVSPQLEPQVLEKWSIDPRTNVGRFNSDQAYFLEHHNAETFRAHAA